MQLTGKVKNGSDGVHIFFNASENAARSFFKQIRETAPAQARIISSQLLRTTDAVFSGFSIVVEKDAPLEKRVLISPDRALCPSCRSELHDPNDRRYRYPFITCTSCGPRYSIIHRLPFERPNSSMQDFSMCKSCSDEYNTLSDRRFFSQTNSCADCGMELRLLSETSACLSNDTESVLANIKDFLQAGKIIAVKGIGGYLLLCDAGNPGAIQVLRSRKHRPTKPFAILYPDIEQVSRDFEVSEQEKAYLLSEEAPIVLLAPGKEAFARLALRNIRPGLRRTGIMLPYSPLLDIIARDYGNPLIATSANISGSPILYKDEDAVAYLFGIADYIVSYNREIVTPQDDSVLQVTSRSNQPILLRRSRGYAPSFLQYTPGKKACVLSMGAFLKSTFTLSVNGNVFVSQFLGSGESYESQQMYKDVLNHWLELYQAKPDIILADRHPNYFSRHYGAELAQKYDINLHLIQHHEAHFAAVLAENELLQTKEPVLGVIWDGTGLGTDGYIWGGEFFRYENKEIRRCYHFGYFPVIAGDKLAQEPRLAALCAAGPDQPVPTTLQEKFTVAEWNNYRSLITGAHLYTSSAGRIFDAVASLLGLCDKQSYEGEAALYLQTLAEEYVHENGFTMDNSYILLREPLIAQLSTASLIQGIMSDVKKGAPKPYIAAKFHYSLVCLIDKVAESMHVEKICFSGGVFQNALLTDWIQIKYKDSYQLFFHKSLSPNDENISFGQLVYYENGISSAGRRETLSDKRETLPDKRETSSDKRETLPEKMSQL